MKVVLKGIVDEVAMHVVIHELGTCVEAALIAVIDNFVSCVLVNGLACTNKEIASPRKCTCLHHVLGRIFGTLSFVRFVSLMSRSSEDMSILSSLLSVNDLLVTILICRLSNVPDLLSS